jgi:hypothetical protein
MATTDKQATKKTARKTTKKQAGKKTAEKQTDNEGDERSPRRGSAPRASAPKRVTGVRVAAMAADQLLELTGKAAEGVTGLQRTDDGWTVQVEVVEVRRIPDTTDVLALYEVEVDEDGELESYRRLRRYARGAPGEE